MPEQYKAESAIVQPKPHNATAIDRVLEAMADAVESAEQFRPVGTGANFIGGFQSALALAIDYGIEVVRDVLATIDAGKRESAVENGEADPDAEVAADAASRAEWVKLVGDAAISQPQPPPQLGHEFRWN